MPLVTDSTQLKERLAALKGDYVAVDTEFLRERTFYSKLCLIQIAGENDAFAIDPLADGMDLTPFFTLMQDETVTKVFHAAKQDLEIFFQTNDGKLPTPLFDTQIAAQMLGYGEAIGYGPLVEKLCGGHIDKSHRHTDWSARPLSEAQINYALSDVTYLHQMYPMMVKELEERGRLSWVQEEMAEMLLSPSHYESHPENAWQIIKMPRGAKPPNRAMAKQLAIWREHQAQQKDKPRQWILKNDLLLEIAATLPKNLKALKKLRFFKNVSNEQANELIKQVELGRNATPPPIEPKGGARIKHPVVFESLKFLLQIQSAQHHVAPSVIAKREDLELLANLKTPDDGSLPENTPDILCLHGWRFEIYGKYALQLKAGLLSVRLDGKKALLEPCPITS